MASSKNTFEPNTFMSNTFACGTWRGTGVDVISVVGGRWSKGEVYNPGFHKGETYNLGFQKGQSDRP